MPKYRPRPALRAALSLALPMALALSGCGGGGSNGDGGSAASTPSAPPSVSAATPSGLTATLAESAASIPVGGSVSYTLTPTNNTSQPITYQTTSAGSVLQLTDASGGTVYPPVTGAGGTGGVVTSIPITFTPGQSSSVVLGQLSVFASAGRYSATETVGLIAGSPSVTDTPVGPLTVTVQ